MNGPRLPRLTRARLLRDLSPKGRRDIVRRLSRQPGVWGLVLLEALQGPALGGGPKRVRAVEVRAFGEPPATPYQTSNDAATVRVPAGFRAIGWHPAPMDPSSVGAAAFWVAVAMWVVVSTIPGLFVLCQIGRVRAFERRAPAVQEIPVEFIKPVPLEFRGEEPQIRAFDDLVYRRGESL